MHYVLTTIVIGAALIQAAPTADQLQKREDNGVGVTPAMGWNNWNAGLSSSAATAMVAANAFVKLGLKDVGYEYVNIDDTWSSMKRDSKGNLQADPNKWPQGIAAVSAQIHAMGLKMGLYGDSGTATCSGYPGSQGYEVQDAKQLAAWNIDYWKYDNCNTPTSGTSQTRYTTMSNALLGSGRTILYSLCNWGANSVYTWGGKVGNSWRVGGDITNHWSSAASIAASNAGIASYAAPGGFNDFDMLEVGNGGLSTAEERAHFGLWAISKSPLILGCDFTKISAASLAIIKNTGVIAINQDSLGRAAAPFRPSGAPAIGNSLYPYYSGKLSDGYVIGLIAVNGAATLSVSFADVPGLGKGSYSWKELYTGATGSGTSVSATLATHDMAIFKVTVPGQAKPAPSPMTSTSTSAMPYNTPPTLPSSVPTIIPSSVTVPTAVPTSILPTSAVPSSILSTSAVPSSILPTSTDVPYAPVSVPAPVSTPVVGTVQQWGQCGGTGYTGDTACVAGYNCNMMNAWYSQCY